MPPLAFKILTSVSFLLFFVDQHYKTKTSDFRVKLPFLSSTHIVTFLNMGNFNFKMLEIPML